MALRMRVGDWIQRNRSRWEAVQAPYPLLWQEWSAGQHGEPARFGDWIKITSEMREKRKGKFVSLWDPWRCGQREGKLQQVLCCRVGDETRPGGQIWRIRRGMRQSRCPGRGPRQHQWKTKTEVSGGAGQGMQFKVILGGEILLKIPSPYLKHPASYIY